jgi:anaerobic glycerol-3-phosphate dehydrogenase
VKFPRQRFESPPGALALSKLTLTLVASQRQFVRRCMPRRPELDQLRRSACVVKGVTIGRLMAEQPKANMLSSILIEAFVIACLVASFLLQC